MNMVLPLPDIPYAITHRAAEDFTLMFASRGKLDARVVRLSNAFGAPAHGSVDRWTLLVNDLCRQAVETKKLVFADRMVSMKETSFRFLTRLMGLSI